MLQPTPSLRGNKHHENIHRPLRTNVIGTLDHLGNWAPEPAYAGLTLNAALTAANAAHAPLLWAYTAPDAVSWEVKFGFDEFVPVIAPTGGGAAPAVGAVTKIGHVALTNQAIISGEIVADGAGWYLDNNSGAWGAMHNRDKKSDMMSQVANSIALGGGIVCRAKRAYSRTAWKRVFQQTTPYERLFRR